MKKKTGRIRKKTAVLAAAAWMVSVLPVYAQGTETIQIQETVLQETSFLAKNTNGWVYENGRWCYYLDGVKQTGPLYLEDGEYLIDQNGYMVSGWYQESADAPYFYYDPSKGGRKASGITQVNGKTYYFQGYMRTNYVAVENGTLYYFGSDGTLQSTKTGIADGWIKMGNDWYYVQNKVLAGGLKTVGTHTYYFEDGRMITSASRMIRDEQTKQDFWYRFDANGYMVTGWYKDGSDWYYYESSGKSAQGMKTVSGVTYYFSTEGKMCTNYSASINGNVYHFGANGVLDRTQSTPENGWKALSGAWYYFRNSEIVKSEFVTEGGHTYYVGADGKMCANTQLWINGYWYRFDGNGYMVTGWFKTGDEWYYYGSDGKAGAGLTKVGGGSYFLEYNGYMVTSSWKCIDGIWYYFTPSGGMATGWKQIGSVWYYFESNGGMATGWKRIGSTWYYLNTSGGMATGWKRISGIWYYFNTSGAMATGWRVINGATYYFRSSGAMATDWCQVDGKWYYMSSGGQMQKNTWVGGIYYVKADGTMAVSEWVDNGRYYVGADGKWIPNP